jgi:hypothetical protein
LSFFTQRKDPEIQKAIVNIQASFGKTKEFGELASDSIDLDDYDEVLTRDRILDILSEQLNGFIDCLFDTLPTIDRLWQVRILELERNSKIST